MNKGDRVKVIKNKKESGIGRYYQVGDMGTLIAVDSDGDWDVTFDSDSFNPGDWFIGEDSLELVEKVEE